MAARFPRYVNQGHRIVAGWDSAATLKNWVAYQGTDGVNFLPPFDRNGYTDGVVRRLNTGGVFMAGWPISRLTFPWISDGQIKYLYVTMLSNAESGNVTAAVHTPLSVGATDTTNYNAVMNLNLDQTTGLTRKSNGYELFEIELVLVEAL
jgi:hypothetical protein